MSKKAKTTRAAAGEAGEGADAASPFRLAQDGVRIAVRLTPRANRDAFEGVVRDAAGRAALKIRVAAPPVDGEANAALVAFVARELRLRPSDVSIASGRTARLKTLRVAMDDGPALLTQLEAWATR